MEKEIDFNCIIPTAGRDCIFLNRHLDLIIKNIQPKKVYIITKKCYFIYFKNNFNILGTPIILLDEDSLIQGLNVKSLKMITRVKNVGWYFQQFLKMGFALTPFADLDYYLVWDADTIPLKKMTFFKNNQPLFTIKNEFHKPYFDTIKKLLGIDKVIEKSFIAENMIINVDIMKELIKNINTNTTITGNNWYEKIISLARPGYSNDFSEFETYGTYIYSTNRNLYDTRELKCLRRAGMLISRLSTTNEIVNKFRKYDLISIEMRHNPDSFKGKLAFLEKIIIHFINKTICLIYK